jgi:Mor family transcriptional regulator
MNKFTEVEIAEMKHRYELGDSYQSIANNYGCSRTTVSRCIKGESKVILQQEIKDKIIAKYVEGATMRELSREYGVSLATIGKTCREAGVNRRKGRPNNETRN